MAAGKHVFCEKPLAHSIAEIAMTGIVALRLGKPIEWDSETMKVKNAPEAEPLVLREQRKKWL